jgi:hypothetical protein
MARQKRGSVVLETARHRLTGIKSITPTPDFGPALTILYYTTQINGFEALLEHYNEVISVLDDLQIQLEAAEAELRKTNARILKAAEAHYGTDSSVYEQAGGKRLSERKRSGKKATPKTAA